MESLRKFILEKVASRELSQDIAGRLLGELIKTKSTQVDPVAIIGMSCRFPLAKSTADYWRLLSIGLSCIRSFPTERWDDYIHVLNNGAVMEFLYERPLTAEEIEDRFTRSGYLDDIDRFDAEFFGIPPKEAAYMDPAHRLLLEVSWEAIEDAGYGPSIYGSNTGVFVGRDGTVDGWMFRQAHERDQIMLTGAYDSLMASRLSYLYNLSGPAMLVDTACSSSMVAVHSAIQSLHQGDCDMALAGGINLFPFKVNNFPGPLNLSFIESKNKTVRTFDRNADGSLFSEGVGIVILKPLSRAINDGDNILAVIKGSAINNDGASNGITAPSPEAQEKVYLKAWQHAGINPETIAYIETHGTGTVLGDPIEIKSLASAFSKFTNKKQFCAIASLKSSLGHMVSASGIGSLIKLVLALQHGQIPPTSNFEEPNPYINFTDGPVYVNDRLRPWQKINGKPRRCAANSFGFAGTNCHIVLEEYQPPEKTDASTGWSGSHCLTISARKRQVLEVYVRRYLDFIEGSNLDDHELGELCYTACTGRGHYGHRLALVVDSPSDLMLKLRQVSTKDLKSYPEQGIFYGAHTIVSEQQTEYAPGEITQKEKNTTSRKAEATLEKIIATGQRRDLMLDLAREYSRGADLPWMRLYAKTKPRRHSAPLYPFERVRHWPGKRRPKVVSTSLEHKPISHPLLQVCLKATPDDLIYRTELHAEEHWVVRDHRLLGMGLLPGTAYLEIVRAVALHGLEASSIELRNVFFLAPCTVARFESRQIFTHFHKQENGYAWTVAGDKNLLATTIFARGELIVTPSAKTDSIKPVILDSASCALADEYAFAPISGIFEFGPRWDTIRAILQKESEVVVELALRDELRDDVGQYGLHPALLDMAVNVLIQKFCDNGVTYLPYTYASLCYFRPFGPRIRAHLRIKEASENQPELVKFDITITNSNNDICAEIRDYSIKKMPNQELGRIYQGSAEYYRVAYRDVEFDASTPFLEGEKILLLKPAHGLANRVHTELVTAGAHVTVVRLGSGFVYAHNGEYEVGASSDDFAALGSALHGRKFSRVIHCGGIDTHTISVCETNTIACLRASRSQSIESLFHLVRMLIREKIEVSNELVLVADNAVLITDQEENINPMGHAFLSMARVIAEEYTSIPCRACDIDAESNIDALLQLLTKGKNGSRRALRKNLCYEPEVTRLDLGKVSTDSMSLQAHGVYVITGGLGGLGLAIAKHLATHQPQARFVLASRSPLPPRETWEAIDKDNDRFRIDQIRAIEALGAQVRCESVDVSDYESVTQMLTRVRTELGPIRGVIHAAGLAGERFLIRKDEAAFLRVLSAKIDGSWNLDRAASEDPIDFFVMFSSMVSLLGGSGQADYAAANAFMDSFAQVLRRRGREAIAVNWSGWKEVGMALAHGAIGDNVLFLPVTNAEGLQHFDTILARRPVNVFPARMNRLVAGTIQVTEGIRFAPDLLRNFTATTNVDAPKISKKRPTRPTSVRVTGKDESTLTTIEKALTLIYAGVLGVDSIDVYSNFQDMGGNSILATHLLTEINQEFSTTIDIADVFSYPSVFQMAKLIGSKISQFVQDNPQSEAAPADSSLIDLVDGVISDSISIDEALEDL